MGIKPSEISALIIKAIIPILIPKKAFLKIVLSCNEFNTVDKSKIML